MLQVVTFNIGGARKLRQPPHKPVKLGGEVAIALKQHLQPATPTFIALQETGFITWETGHSSSAHQALAENMGGEVYRAYFAPELNTYMQPHGNLWNRAVYEGARAAGEGNGFVTNLPFAAWDWETFSHTQDHWTHTQISHAQLYSSGNRDTQPRNLMVASLAHPQYGALYLLNTHWGTLSGEKRHEEQHPRTQAGEALRMAQATETLRVVQELRAAEQHVGKAPRPIILCGDFNATPDAPSLQALQTAFELLTVENPPQEAYSHLGHQILIDHVLVSDPQGILPPARTFVQTDVVFNDLSDHLPVIAIFGMG